MSEYRDSIWQTLDTLQDALRGQLEKRGQVEARRGEIEQLGLKLGIYEHSKAFGRGVKGTNFARLWPSALPGLFDDSYPELRTDRQVLGLLEQIAALDETVRQREPRQVLVNREATRQATIRENAARLQAEVLAAITPVER